MRALACIKCKEYVNIHTGNAVNNELLNDFKGKHRSHTVITVQIEEIKGEYSKYNPNESPDSSKTPASVKI